MAAAVVAAAVVGSAAAEDTDSPGPLHSLAMALEAQPSGLIVDCSAFAAH